MLRDKDATGAVVERWEEQEEEYGNHGVKHSFFPFLFF